MGHRPVDRATTQPAAEQQARRADRPTTAPKAPTATYVDVMQLQLSMLLAERPYAAVNVVVNPRTVGSLLHSIEYLLKEGVRYIVLVPDNSEPWPEEAIEALVQQSRILSHFYASWSDAGDKSWPIPFDASHVE